MSQQNADSVARSWPTHAGRDPRNGGFRNFGDPRTVAMYGHSEIVAVTLIEDPEGTYWGWLDGLTPPQSPKMVQGRKGIFDMQFPYGPQAEADRGRGEIVRLRVEEQNDAAVRGRCPNCADPIEGEGMFCSTCDAFEPGEENDGSSQETS